MQSSTIAGIVILVLIILGIGGGVFYYYYSNRKDITVTINDTNVTVEKGKTFQFKATVREASGQEINTNVKWASSDPNKGTIGDNGLFTAIGDSGSVTITATSVEDPTKNASTSVSLKPVVIDYRVQNQIITDTEPLYSANGNYYATTLPADGQLCVKTKDGATKWCLGNKDGSNATTHFTVMQGDGNLCGYAGPSLKDKSGSARCISVFDPNALAPTDTRPNNFVKMQDDGKLCTFAGVPTAPVKQLWCSS